MKTEKHTSSKNKRKKLQKKRKEKEKDHLAVKPDAVRSGSELRLSEFEGATDDDNISKVVEVNGKHVDDGESRYRIKDLEIEMPSSEDRPVVSELSFVIDTTATPAGEAQPFRKIKTLVSDDGESLNLTKDLEIEMSSSEDRPVVSELSFVIDTTVTPAGEAQPFRKIKTLVSEVNLTTSNDYDASGLENIEEDGQETEKLHLSRFESPKVQVSMISIRQKQNIGVFVKALPDTTADDDMINQYQCPAIHFSPSKCDVSPHLNKTKMQDKIHSHAIHSHITNKSSKQEVSQISTNSEKSFEESMKEAHSHVTDFHTSRFESSEINVSVVPTVKHIDILLINSSSDESSSLCSSNSDNSLRELSTKEIEHSENAGIPRTDMRYDTSYVNFTHLRREDAETAEVFRRISSNASSEGHVEHLRSVTRGFQAHSSDHQQHFFVRLLLDPRKLASISNQPDYSEILKFLNFEERPAVFFKNLALLAKTANVRYHPECEAIVRELLPSDLATIDLGIFQSQILSAQHVFEIVPKIHSETSPPESMSTDQITSQMSESQAATVLSLVSGIEIGTSGVENSPHILSNEDSSTDFVITDEDSTDSAEIILLKPLSDYEVEFPSKVFENCAQVSRQTATEYGLTGDGLSNRDMSELQKEDIGIGEEYGNNETQDLRLPEEEDVIVKYGSYEDLQVSTENCVSIVEQTREEVHFSDHTSNEIHLVKEEQTEKPFNKSSFENDQDMFSSSSLHIETDSEVTLVQKSEISGSARQQKDRHLLEISLGISDNNDILIIPSGDHEVSVELEHTQAEIHRTVDSDINELSEIQSDEIFNQEAVNTMYNSIETKLASKEIRIEENFTQPEDPVEFDTTSEDVERESQSSETSEKQMSKSKRRRLQRKRQRRPTGSEFVENSSCELHSLDLEDDIFIAKKDEISTEGVIDIKNIESVDVDISELSTKQIGIADNNEHIEEIDNDVFIADQDVEESSSLNTKTINTSEFTTLYSDDIEALTLVVDKEGLTSSSEALDDECVIKNTECNDAITLTRDMEVFEECETKLSTEENAKSECAESTLFEKSDILSSESVEIVVEGDIGEHIEETPSFMFKSVEEEFPPAGFELESSETLFLSQIESPTSLDVDETEAFLDTSLIEIGGPKVQLYGHEREIVDIEVSTSLPQDDLYQIEISKSDASTSLLEDNASHIKSDTSNMDVSTSQLEDSTSTIEIDIAEMEVSTSKSWADLTDGHDVEIADKHFEDTTSQIEIDTSEIKLSRSLLEEGSSQNENDTSNIEIATSQLEDSTSYIEIDSAEIEATASYLEDTILYDDATSQVEKNIEDRTLQLEDGTSKIDIDLADTEMSTFQLEDCTYKIYTDTSENAVGRPTSQLEHDTSQFQTDTYDNHIDESKELFEVIDSENSTTPHDDPGFDGFNVEDGESVKTSWEYIQNPDMLIDDSNIKENITVDDNQCLEVQDRENQTIQEDMSVLESSEDTDIDSVLKTDTTSIETNSSLMVTKLSSNIRTSATETKTSNLRHSGIEDMFLPAWMRSSTVRDPFLPSWMQDSTPQPAVVKQSDHFDTHAKDSEVCTTEEENETRDDPTMDLQEEESHVQSAIRYELSESLLESEAVKVDRSQNVDTFEITHNIIDDCTDTNYVKLLEERKEEEDSSAEFITQKANDTSEIMDEEYVEMSDSFVILSETYVKEKDDLTSTTAEIVEDIESYEFPDLSTKCDDSGGMDEISFSAKSWADLTDGHDLEILDKSFENVDKYDFDEDFTIVSKDDIPESTEVEDIERPSMDIHKSLSKTSGSESSLSELDFSADDFDFGTSSASWAEMTEFLVEDCEFETFAIAEEPEKQQDKGKHDPFKHEKTDDEKKNSDRKKDDDKEKERKKHEKDSDIKRYKPYKKDDDDDQGQGGVSSVQTSGQSGVTQCQRGRGDGNSRDTGGRDQQTTRSQGGQTEHSRSEVVCERSISIQAEDKVTTSASLSTDYEKVGDKEDMSSCHGDPKPQPRDGYHDMLEVYGISHKKRSKLLSSPSISHPSTCSTGSLESSDKNLVLEAFGVLSAQTGAGEDVSEVEIEPCILDIGELLSRPDSPASYDTDSQISTDDTGLSSEEDTDSGAKAARAVAFTQSFHIDNELEFPELPGSDVTGLYNTHRCDSPEAAYVESWLSCHTVGCHGDETAAPLETVAPGDDVPQLQGGVELPSPERVPLVGENTCFDATPEARPSYLEFSSCFEPHEDDSLALGGNIVEESVGGADRQEERRDCSNSDEVDDYKEVDNYKAQLEEVHSMMTSFSRRVNNNLDLCHLDIIGAIDSLVERIAGELQAGTLTSSHVWHSLSNLTTGHPGLHPGDEGQMTNNRGNSEAISFVPEEQTDEADEREIRDNTEPRESKDQLEQEIYDILGEIMSLLTAMGEGERRQRMQRKMSDSFDDPFNGQFDDCPVGSVVGSSEGSSPLEVSDGSTGSSAVEEAEAVMSSVDVKAESESSFSSDRNSSIETVIDVDCESVSQAVSQSVSQSVSQEFGEECQLRSASPSYTHPLLAMQELGGVEEMETSVLYRLQTLYYVDSQGNRQLSHPSKLLSTSSCLKENEPNKDNKIKEFHVEEEKKYEEEMEENVAVTYDRKILDHGSFKAEAMNLKSLGEDESAKESKKGDLVSKRKQLKRSPSLYERPMSASMSRVTSDDPGKWEHIFEEKEVDIDMEIENNDVFNDPEIDEDTKNSQDKSNKRIPSLYERSMSASLSRAISDDPTKWEHTFESKSIDIATFQEVQVTISETETSDTIRKDIKRVPSIYGRQMSASLSRITSDDPENWEHIFEENQTDTNTMVEHDNVFYCLEDKNGKADSLPDVQQSNQISSLYVRPMAADLSRTTINDPEKWEIVPADLQFEILSETKSLDGTTTDQCVDEEDFTEVFTESTSFETSCLHDPPREEVTCVKLDSYKNSQSLKSETVYDSVSYTCPVSSASEQLGHDSETKLNFVYGAIAKSGLSDKPIDTYASVVSKTPPRQTPPPSSLQRQTPLRLTPPQHKIHKHSRSDNSGESGEDRNLSKSSRKSKCQQSCKPVSTSVSTRTISSTSSSDCAVPDSTLTTELATGEAISKSKRRRLQRKRLKDQLDTSQQPHVDRETKSDKQTSRPQYEKNVKKKSKKSSRDTPSTSESESILRTNVKSPHAVVETYIDTSAVNNSVKIEKKKKRKQRNKQHTDSLQEKFYSASDHKQTQEKRKSQLVNFEADLVVRGRERVSSLCVTRSRRDLRDVGLDETDYSNICRLNVPCDGLERAVSMDDSTPNTNDLETSRHTARGRSKSAGPPSLQKLMGKRKKYKKNVVVVSNNKPL